MTFTQLNHPFIHCLAPPSFLLWRNLCPLPTGATEPAGQGTQRSPPLPKQVPTTRPSFLRNTQPPHLQLGGLQAQPRHSHRDGCRFPSSGAQPRLCPWVSLASASTWKHPPQLQAHPSHPVSAAIVSPAGPNYLHHPPVPPPGGRRRENTCIPRYPKEIQPPSQSWAKPGLGTSAHPLQSHCPHMPGSPKRSRAAAEQHFPGISPQREGTASFAPSSSWDRALDEAAVLSPK